jgi:wyosine [tRNA(Phe)-imidazoG37] synthetase (radical SAM superfamily)
MIAFGPVPSRRLGRSLGINNIPPKVCTYSCVYCQLGRTMQLRLGRSVFYKLQEVLMAVRRKVAEAQEVEEPIDYLTFVHDGEPALDFNLGWEIDLLRPLGIKVAVITNASTIWRWSIRAVLTKADWVSLKVDSTREEVWRRIDRPHRSLRLASILDGMLTFARTYRGKLVTETMLVEGVNDSDDQVSELGEFLARSGPARAYLAVPTRPPAEEWVRSPSEAAITRAYEILSTRMDQVEYLIGYEGNAFASTGNVEEDLLSITAVHPMRQDAVSEFLARAGADWSTVLQLINVGQLIETRYEGMKFRMRRLR